MKFELYMTELGNACELTLGWHGDPGEGFPGPIKPKW
jgi:hypothetical protein